MGRTVMPDSTQSPTQLAGETRPSHIPPDLVRPYPYILGARTKAHPHDFAADIHKGPPLFWADSCGGGVGDGGWVPRRFEDIQSIFFDTAHFSSQEMAQYSKMIGEV